MPDYGFTNSGGPGPTKPSQPESIGDILRRMGYNQPPGAEPRDPGERRDPRPTQDLERHRTEIDNELQRRAMEEKRTKAEGDAARAKAEGDRKIADTRAKADQMRKAYEQKYGPERRQLPSGGTRGNPMNFNAPLLALLMGGDQAQGLQQFRQQQGTNDPAESDPLWTQLLNLFSRTR